MTSVYFLGLDTIEIHVIPKFPITPKESGMFLGVCASREHQSLRTVVPPGRFVYTNTCVLLYGLSARIVSHASVASRDTH